MSIHTSGEYEDRGLRLLNLERPAEALTVFEEGARRFPGNADLVMGAAMSHLRLGDYVRACEILEGLRRTQPRSEEALQALAESYLARGMTGEAVRAAVEAAGGSSDSRLLHRLARTFYDRQCYREALAFYERAAELAPEWGEAWFGLGACRWALRRPELAESALRRTVELAPEDWQARQFLGCVLYESGRKDEALKTLESVPLDAPWQKPALERLIALSGWSSDAERGPRLEELWRRVMAGGAPRGALDVLEELSRKMDEYPR